MKNGRRTNGEGSITKFRKGFKGRLSHNGNNKYVYGKTKKEVSQKLQELRIQLGSGVDIFTPKITFAELTRQYLERYAVNVRPATRQNYENYSNKIAEDGLGRIAVSDIKAADFQDFANRLSASGRNDGAGGLAAKTIRNIFNFIGAVLKMARANSLIVTDPSEFVSLPREHTIEKAILTPAQIDSLIAAADGDWSIGIYILPNTGVRSGECLGLRADSLCEADGFYYLEITNSLRRVKNFNAQPGEPKTHLVLTDLKTDNSHRKIPLPTDVAEHIKSIIAQKQTLAKRYPGLYVENPFLVSNELGDKVEPSSFRKYFNKTVELAGLPSTTTQHTLRHSRASLLIQQGCSPKMVSLYCGHSEPGFTLARYCHYSLEDMTRELLIHAS